MQIKVDADISTIFNEYVYVDREDTFCECEDIMIVPVTPVNVDPKINDMPICATCSNFITEEQLELCRRSRDESGFNDWDLERE